MDEWDPILGGPPSMAAGLSQGIPSIPSITAGINPALSSQADLDRMAMPPPPLPRRNLDHISPPAAAPPSFPGGRDILAPQEPLDLGSPVDVPREFLGLEEYSDGYPIGAPLFDDMYLGQPRSAPPYGHLHGSFDDDFHMRPALLTEPLPGGAISTAREDMPRTYPIGRGERTMRDRDRRWPGPREAWPEGAIGYVGRDEPNRWGHYDGPSMWPAEVIGPEQVAMKERDADWSPPGEFPEERTRFGGPPPGEVAARGGLLDLVDDLPPEFGHPPGHGLSLWR